MDDSPQTLPPFAPPAEPRRPAWEVALLFAGILVLVGLWGWAQWSAGAREKKFSSVRGVADTRMADRFAGLATGAPGPSAAALWKRAVASYREALAENPGLARARRGLAAALYLQGDREGARDAMSGTVSLSELSADGRRAWEATQMAFGAAARPVNTASLDEQRAALKDPDLGWSRYPALMALAPNDVARERYRAAMVEEYGGGSILALMSVTMFVALALIPVGFVLLERGLKMPRNRLPVLHASARALIVTFLVAFVIYQAGSGVFAGIASAFGEAVRGGGGVRKGGGVGLLVMLVGGGAVGLAMALLYAMQAMEKRGSSLAELGWRTRGAWKWAIGGYVAMFPLLGAALFLVTLLTRLFPNVNTPENPAADLVLATGGWRLVLVFVLVCVIAPVAEELLFRGLLFRGLEKRYGLLVGALASALLFGGMHPQLPFGFPPLFVLGIGLCYVYRISGSLVPAILIHAMNNTIALLMALAIGGAGK